MPRQRYEVVSLERDPAQQFQRVGNARVGGLIGRGGGTRRHQLLRRERLEFHDVGAGRLRHIDHLAGPANIAVVIDSGLGDHEGTAPHCGNRVPVFTSVFAGTAAPGRTTEPAPIIENAPTVTAPSTIAPGATCTPSAMLASCSTIAPVLTITPCPILELACSTAPAITCEPSPSIAVLLTTALG